MTDQLNVESLAERRIRDAMARGEFDDLPGMGKPIPGAGSRDDDLWWVRRWVKRQHLEEDTVLEGRHIDDALGRIWMLPSESKVREAVLAVNGQHPDSLDATEVLGIWRAMAGGRRRLSDR